eukprot:TRINITY_DN12596_c0_g1_i1.p1 TRINITY_DN12596_c0_g1~~TRINITY_DN12596_c0_g1_i1.p1  ORF type:complete len:290 (-),score=33.87 TRINITY_DN12596_c0_g1_i1:367-1236(-)
MFTRLGRTPTAATLIARRSPSPKVFTRIGRAPQLYTRLGRAPASQLYTRMGRSVAVMESAPEALGDESEIFAGRETRAPADMYTRIGRAPKVYTRLGRAPQLYTRIGRSAAPSKAFTRIGRAPKLYTRMGRAPQLYTRIGRSYDPYSRTGRASHLYTRVGRSNAGAVQRSRQWEKKKFELKRADHIFTRIGRSGEKPNAKRRQQLFTRMGRDPVAMVAEPVPLPLPAYVLPAADHQDDETAYPDVHYVDDMADLYDDLSVPADDNTGIDAVKDSNDDNGGKSAEVLSKP